MFLHRLATTILSNRHFIYIMVHYYDSAKIKKIVKLMFFNEI